MESTYTIPEVERENILKLVARFQKKAAAYEKELAVHFGTPYATERKIYDERFDGEAVRRVLVGTELVEVFDVAIDCDIIRKDGYTVVAKIEHLDAGNIVYPIGDEDAKPEWYNALPKCEHCGNNRHRRVTFIVRHEDGTEKQVGRSCLKDYCGINPEYVMWLNQLHDIILDDSVDNYDFRSCASAKAYSTVKMLALAKKIIAEQGYVKSGERNSNRDMLCSFNGSYNPTDAEMDDAQEMADKIASFDNSEFCDSVLENIKTLVRSGYCKHSHFGYIAYAPIAYEKYMEMLKRKAEREAQLDSERTASEYVGEIGQRITVSLSEMKLLTSWQNDFGYTYLYKFVDTAGNILVWFASRTVDECKTIKATVKDHTVRDGVKQTIITRCKAA